MYLYIKTLFQITVKAGDTESHIDVSSRTRSGTTEMVNIPKSGEIITINVNNKGKQKENEVNLRQAQLELIENMTKNTLLGLIGLLSTMMLNVKTVYEWIIDERGDPSLWRCMSALDGAINIGTMWLIFSVTKRCYNVLCKYPHYGLNKGCIWTTKKSVINNKTVIENQLGDYIERE